LFSTFREESRLVNIHSPAACKRIRTGIKSRHAEKPINNLSLRGSSTMRHAEYCNQPTRLEGIAATLSDPTFCE